MQMRTASPLNYCTVDVSKKPPPAAVLFSRRCGVDSRHREKTRCSYPTLPRPFLIILTILDDLKAPSSSCGGFQSRDIKTFFFLVQMLTGVCSGCGLELCLNHPVGITLWNRKFHTSYLHTCRFRESKILWTILFMYFIHRVYKKGTAQ